jgi:putative membrane protein
VYASSTRRESPSGDRSADPRPTGATYNADGVAPSVAWLEGRLVMMGWYRHGMGAWAWTFLGLFWFVIIGLVVLCTVVVLNARTHVGHTRDLRPRDHSGISADHDDSCDDSAIAILDRRFARGEIDEQTFRAHRSALTNRPRRDDD